MTQVGENCRQFNIHLAPWMKLHSQLKKVNADKVKNASDNNPRFKLFDSTLGIEIYQRTISEKYSIKSDAYQVSILFDKRLE